MTAGRIVYNDGGPVQPKYHINSENFSYGFVTPDDHWDNYWREGRNANLGWSSSLPGHVGSQLHHKLANMVSMPINPLAFFDDSVYTLRFFAPSK